MRKYLPLLFLLALSQLPGCSSSASNPMPASLIAPELTIRAADPGYLPSGYRGSLTVQLMIDVANRSSEELTLERIHVESMGSGGYRIRSASSFFKTKIAPGQFETVRLWATGVIDDPVFGASSPVTIRSVANFNSPAGRFQHVSVLQLRNGLSAPRRRD